jgi:hypothetical protein
MTRRVWVACLSLLALLPVYRVAAADLPPVLDAVRDEVQQALGRRFEAFDAADVAAAKAIRRQLELALDGGELERSKHLRDALQAFTDSGTFETTGLAALEEAKRARLRARQAAVADVVAVYERGVRTYTRNRDAAAAAKLRAEQAAFVARFELPSSLPRGAVLHLSFEADTLIQQAGETFVRDLSGNDIRCRLRGATVTAEGRVGSAVSFDAGADIDCGNSPKLNFTCELTIAAFVRIAKPVSGPVVSKDYWDGGPPRGYVLRLWDGRPDITIGTKGGWRPVTADTPLTPNQWQHVAATFDGNTLRLYVEGKERGSREVTTVLHASPSPLTLGRGTYDRGRQFAGGLDELMLFDRALSADEVAALAGRH